MSQSQFIKSQPQNLIPILKVSVSKIDTGYTESQPQHAKTGLTHPCWVEPYGMKFHWSKIPNDQNCFDKNIFDRNFLTNFFCTIII